MTRMGMIASAILGASVMATTACAPAPAPAPALPKPTAAVPPSSPDHIMIVVLENKDERDVVREAPYLSSLAATGAVLTDMHAQTHPSQPNYIVMFSGDTQGVHNDDCPLRFDAPNLATELTTAGFTFAGYSEDLPEFGYTGCRSGGYARKHNPWVDFSNVPAAANLPLSAMPTDYADLPTVSFLVPNLCHDMHDCSIAEGDAWLRGMIDGYAQWARTHNSLLVVTFDESETKSDPANHIATFAVGQKVVPGPDPGRADHYRLLRTIEDLYGLAPLGRSADTTGIAGLWRTTGSGTAVTGR